MSKLKAMTRSVSVIIAARNAEKTIARAIGSVMHQEDVGVEIIVVDDASTDGTVNVVKSLQSSTNHLQLVSNASNLGVAKSRNIGLKMATQEFVSTLDADDYYCDRLKLSREVGIVEASGDENVIGFSGVLHVKTDGSLIQKLEPGIQPITFERMLCRECFIPRDFTLKRDLILEVGGYDEHIAIYEDWDLKLRLSRLAKYTYTGQFGVAYVQHDSGLSKHSSLSYWRNFVLMKHVCALQNPEARVDVLGSAQCERKGIRYQPHFSRRARRAGKCARALP